jgi:predicted ATP-binding protein involved in virulence
MTTVLQKLSLNAYRGVSGMVFESLTPVSLVVGANNSGKSSILEAAGIVLRPPDPGQWFSAVRRRDLDMALADGIWSMFPGAQTLHSDDEPTAIASIKLEAQLSGAHRLVEATASALPVLRNGGTDELSVRVGVSVDGEPPIEMRFPSSKVVSHQVPMYRVFTATPASHYSTALLVEQLSQVIDAGRKQLAVELLQIFDPLVRDIDVVASLERSAVRVTHSRRGVVDLSSFGDGMRRGVVLALTLARAHQGVLLLDEIETGIHANLLRPVLSKLIAAAATSQVQILATTHSLEAVDALVSAVADHNDGDSLAAYWVQRKEEQHEARRYDFERLQRMREGGLDIR